MKKLAVGAENWSIDTFELSVDFCITGSGLFLPHPQMGRARIAEGLRTPRQAATDIPPLPRLQLSNLHVSFFLTQLQVLFCSPGEDSEGRVVIERGGIISSE